MCSKDKGKYKYKLECDYGCDGFDFDVKPKTRSDVSARMASVSSYSVRSAGVGDVCLGSFKRQNSSVIRILDNNHKRGMEHILKRHSPDHFPDHDKGDLFPLGTTNKQILDAVRHVYAKGNRISNTNRAVQNFEKRIKINGETANYRLSVDTNLKEVITFYKVGGNP